MERLCAGVSETSGGIKQMRRRQRYATREQSTVPDMPPIPAPPPPRKGECPHCRRHIGRGVAFHVKHCRKRHV